MVKEPLAAPFDKDHREARGCLRLPPGIGKLVETGREHCAVTQHNGPMLANCDLVAASR